MRVLDYDRPETLQDAFQRGDRVLLVSSNSAGERHTAQHQAVITAAAGAGVGLIAYTSVLGAPTATFAIGRDHYRTEQLLLASGVSYTLLRNGWYNENYTGHLDAILQLGQVFGWPVQAGSPPLHASTTPRPRRRSSPAAGTTTGPTNSPATPRSASPTWPRRSPVKRVGGSPTQSSQPGSIAHS